MGRRASRMKRVIKGTDTDNPYILKSLLESNGIPVFISGEGAGRVLPFLLSKPDLWIYLDEQYDEALALIQDPDYEVMNKVDVEAFYELAHDPSPIGLSTTGVFVRLAVYLALIIAVLLLAIRLLQWLQG